MRILSSFFRCPIQLSPFSCACTLEIQPRELEGHFFFSILFFLIFFFPWARVVLLNSLTLGTPAFSEHLFTLQHWNTDWQLELPFRSGIAADFLNRTAIRSPHYGCLSFLVLNTLWCALPFHQFQLKTHSNPGWKPRDLYQHIDVKRQICACFCFISLQDTLLLIPSSWSPLCLSRQHCVAGQFSPT